MIGKHGIHPCADYLINDVFTLCRIATRDRRWGQAYRITLANHAKQYEAIAGPSAATVAIGKQVRVRGCLLFCQGQPVLVVCSLQPVIFDPEGV